MPHRKYVRTKSGLYVTEEQDERQPEQSTRGWFMEERPGVMVVAMDPDPVTRRPRKWYWEDFDKEECWVTED